MSEKKQNAISEEVAISEMHSFLSKWQKRPIEFDKVKDEYLDCVEAIMSGNLVIDADKVPVYTLKHPVTSESGSVVASVVNFRTRVAPSAKANLADGLDLQKQTAKFSLRVIAHVCGVATVKELDNYHPHDYDVMSQLATVFM